MRISLVPLARFVAVLTIAATGVDSCEASFRLLRQLGRASHLRGTELVDEQHSDALVPLELQANHSFNESQMFTNFPPAHISTKGIDGTIFVSAIADDGDDRRSTARLEYEFEVQTPAEYFLRYAKQGDADSMYSLADANGNIVELTQSQNLVQRGTLAPGVHLLTIDVNAFRPFISGVFEQDHAQIDFALLVTPVPEPATVSLATIMLLCLLPRRAEQFGLL